MAADDDAPRDDAAGAAREGGLLGAAHRLPGAGALGDAAEAIAGVGGAVVGAPLRAVRRAPKVADSLLWGSRRASEPGAEPGQIVVDPEAPAPVVTVIGYGPDTFEEAQDVDLAKVAACRGRQAVTWVDVEGLGDADVLRELGELFGVHPLALEDIAASHQRAKAERYGEHVFLVSRMASIEDETDVLHTEQVSFYLGRGFLLTFQEGYRGDSFEPVRKRLRVGEGSHLRGAGADFLMYALLDAVVDAFFPVMEHYSDHLEDLEDDVLFNPSKSSMSRIHEIKRNMLALRRAVWPMREAVNTVMRDENPVVEEQTRTYLLDVYDHVVQIIDLLETYRELASGLVDLYLSSVSNRMNEVMKVLTIIATIFIPLGFIAGLYGMNFDRATSAWNMPELGWKYGYPYALGLMVAVVVVMLVYFQRKGWMFTRDHDPHEHHDRLSREGRGRRRS